jgi:hypothetical protein
MYDRRIQQLERAFKLESFDQLAPFQIYTSWFRVFAIEVSGFGRISDCQLSSSRM